MGANVRAILLRISIFVYQNYYTIYRRNIALSARLTIKGCGQASGQMKKAPVVQLRPKTTTTPSAPAHAKSLVSYSTQKEPLLRFFRLHKEL